MKGERDCGDNGGTYCTAMDEGIRAMVGGVVVFQTNHGPARSGPYGHGPVHQTVRSGPRWTVDRGIWAGPKVDSG